MNRLLCGLVLAVALTGCATPHALASPKPDSATTPTAELSDFAAATAVDPADYGPPWYGADGVGTETVDGVDFDSPDHTIHCGIYAPYFDDARATPFAGCYADTVSFTFPAVLSDGQGYIHATAVTMRGADESAATWMSGQEFGAHSNALAEGTSITWSTVTCASVEGGIRCANSASGHGFFISPDRYEVDREAPEQFDNDEYVQDDAGLYTVNEGPEVSAFEWLTPSKNVACAITANTADADYAVTLECRAADHTWSGAGVGIAGDEPTQLIDSGNASFVAGQVLEGTRSAAIRVLPYGHFVHWGNFRCVSLDTGLECENWESHHGFTISKSKLETH